MSDLSEKQLNYISGEILLDMKEMQNNEKSPFALTYLADEFRSEDKRHNVKKLLRLGWHLCEHTNQFQQGEELWFLISPDLAESVPKS